MNWENVYDQWLYKFNVYNHDYFFVRTGEFPSNGYCSLYAVSREVAEALETSGFASYKGVVWSPELVIDFDSYEAGEAARRRLKELNLPYKMYESGGKGYHFYIHRPHGPSHNLPKIDKQWVSKNFPDADLTLYTHLHQLRLPGTVHEKTGNKKRLVEEVTNLPPLIIQELEQVEIYTPQRGSHRPVNNESLFTNTWIQSLTCPAEEGDRHAILMKLGLSLKKLGEPLEFIARYLHHTNLLFSLPKPDDELERLVRFISEADVELEDQDI